MTDGFTMDDIVLARPRPLLSFGQFILLAFFRVALMAGNADCIIMDPHLVPFLLPIVLILSMRRLTTHSPVLILQVYTNPVEEGGPIKTLMWKFLAQTSVGLANIFFDKVLFISPMLRDYYCDLSHVPRHKTAIWPSSVDIRVFDSKLSSDHRVKMLKKKLRIGNKLCLIYHGNLTRPRGIMELLRAMSLLKRGGQGGVMLILLGYGPLRGEIKRYVQLESLEDVVIIPEPAETAEEVAEYIAVSDVEIIPMPDNELWRYQCFIKVLECLAMNKPLISSSLPAVRAIVGDVPVVYWLRGTKERDIAAGILGYLRTRGSLRPALGRTIASRYSVEAIAENLEADIKERN